jgi:hypothetical protein
MDIKDLMERAKKKNLNMIFNPENNLVMLVKTTDKCEGDAYDLYKDFEVYGMKKKKLQKIDMKVLVQETTKVLAKHVRPEVVVKNILRDLSPSEIVEVFERAVIKKGKIKSGNGCFELRIGGKKGYPFVIGTGRV